MKNADSDIRKGLPNPDDHHLRAPVDRVAARVVGRGEHFGGFSTNTEELCSPVPIALREFPKTGGSLPDYRGKRAGKLTVVGLGTVEQNAGYLGRDKTLPTKANERRARANYQGSFPEKRATRKTGEARWVCRCSCGNYTLRSSKAIRNILQPDPNKGWRNYEDACVQCRELDKRRKTL